MPLAASPGADTVLGPEMKSTGEVMGIARNFPGGVREDAAGHQLRAARGRHGVRRVCDRDKRAIVPIARDIARLGFSSWPRAARPARCGRPAWSASR